KDSLRRHSRQESQPQPGCGQPTLPVYQTAITATALRPSLFAGLLRRLHQKYSTDMKLLERIMFSPELMNGLRFDFRRLLKVPDRMAVAVLTLAVGIGAEATLRAANE